MCTFGPLADVLVINVSSPNALGLRGLQPRSFLLDLLSAVMVKEMYSCGAQQAPTIQVLHLRPNGD